MSAPTLVERIPTAAVPVHVERPTESTSSRARFRAGVITGAVLIVLDVAGIVYYFTAGLAS